MFYKITPQQKPTGGVVGTQRISLLSPRFLVDND